MMGQCYTVDATQVAHQLIDGEVIVVDFLNGAYFSLRETAALIWQALLNGKSVTHIISEYIDQYPEQREQIESTIPAFVESLVEDGLLHSAESENQGGSESFSAASSDGAFVPPVREKFEDMSELLMLDPIHDVDEMGWPRSDNKLN
ncbi:hypothetical protein BOW53_04685 [Solemya pervernicosa gill symbiont]|uniref:PqqD family protein n=2 Tax=Gammaproteobacteria incertae sedis TaxID=118884 RepID=A0A1T2L7T2_9GAMM|nr:PqqD family protein [Candidatus Reidiella endopervernicosa]OOZ41168.1 hypothetical protein BOW53_04685 [Solemya pervernicosa gill symbiont]QKQ27111.1 PqqD family protein [Candidatus Reidiella endopervernicosa]